MTTHEIWRYLKVRSLGYFLSRLDVVRRERGFDICRIINGAALVTTVIARREKDHET